MHSDVLVAAKFACAYFAFFPVKPRDSELRIAVNDERRTVKRFWINRTSFEFETTVMLCVLKSVHFEISTSFRQSLCCFDNFFFSLQWIRCRQNWRVSLVIKISAGQETIKIIYLWTEENRKRTNKERKQKSKRTKRAILRSTRKWSIFQSVTIKIESFFYFDLTKVGRINGWDIRPIVNVNCFIYNSTEKLKFQLDEFECFSFD